MSYIKNHLYWVEMQINSLCIIYNGKQLFTDFLGIKIKKTGYLERFGDESFVFFIYFFAQKQNDQTEIHIL